MSSFSDKHQVKDEQQGKTFPPNPLTTVTGRFLSSSVRPIGRIQRFFLIQLKPNHHRLDVFNYSRHSVPMT